MNIKQGLAPIALVIVAAVLLGMGGFVWYFFAYVWAVPPSTAGDIYSPPSLDLSYVNPETLSDWKTYRNEKYGFEFQYPNVSESFSKEEWFAFDEGDYCVSFGPVSSRSGGFVWGICAYDPACFDEKRAIAEIGSQFPDRKQNTTKSTISGADALTVVTTTAKYSRWVSKMVFIEHNGRVFQFSNGAIENPDFDTALSTFKFTR